MIDKLLKQESKTFKLNTNFTNNAEVENFVKEIFKNDSHEKQKQNFVPKFQETIDPINCFLELPEIRNTSLKTSNSSFNEEKNERSRKTTIEKKFEKYGIEEEIQNNPKFNKELIEILKENTSVKNKIEEAILEQNKKLRNTIAQLKIKDEIFMQKKQKSIQRFQITLFNENILKNNMNKFEQIQIQSAWEENELDTKENEFLTKLLESKLQLKYIRDSNTKENSINFEFQNFQKCIDNLINLFVKARKPNKKIVQRNKLLHSSISLLQRRDEEMTAKWKIEIDNFMENMKKDIDLKYAEFFKKR
jgi:hypothetical protein